MSVSISARTWENFRPGVRTFCRQTIEHEGIVRNPARVSQFDFECFSGGRFRRHGVWPVLPLADASSCQLLHAIFGGVTPAYKSASYSGVRRKPGVPPVSAERSFGADFTCQTSASFEPKRLSTTLAPAEQFGFKRPPRTRSSSEISIIGMPVLREVEVVAYRGPGTRAGISNGHAPSELFPVLQVGLPIFKSVHNSHRGCEASHGTFERNLAVQVGPPIKIKHAAEAFPRTGVKAEPRAAYG